MKRSDEYEAPHLRGDLRSRSRTRADASPLELAVRDVCERSVEMTSVEFMTVSVIESHASMRPELEHVL